MANRGDDSEPGVDPQTEPERDPWWFMPSPQVAAVAVMALLAAGIVLGTVTNPLARSAGSTSILLEEAGEPESSKSEPEAAAGAPSYSPPPTASASFAEAPLAAPAPPAAPAPATPPAKQPPVLPEEEALPNTRRLRRAP